MRRSARAYLACFTDPMATRRPRDRYAASGAGGGGKVVATDVQFAGAQAKRAGESVTLVFDFSGATAEATVQALELPRQWKDFSWLVAECTARQSARLEMVVVGARCRLIRSIDLEPGQRTTVRLSLDDIPLTAGIQPPWTPVAVRFSLREIGDMRTDWDRFMGKGRESLATGAMELAIHDMHLEPRVGANPAIVDRFGQRVHGNWGNKVHDEAALPEAAIREGQDLETMPAIPHRSPIGSDMRGPRFEATGFFRTERTPTGVWWLVDPDGWPFWSIGIACVRLAGNEFTSLVDREEAFAEVPPAPTDFFNGESISFYWWNVVRKYGSLDAWRERVAERFAKWGANSLSGFMSGPMYDQTAIPHLRIARSEVAGVPMADRFADVFHEAWLPGLQAAVAEIARPSERNLIGYFVDNELPWSRMNLLEHAEPDTPLRRKWEEVARSRFGDPATVGKAFGVDLQNWAAVRNLRCANVPEGAARDAVDALEDLYAETYFAGARQAVKAADPNHLYVGCRFVSRSPRQPIVAAAGRHCDVLSVNCYSLIPEKEKFQQWYDWSGARIPILLTEHHLALFSERQLPPIFPAFSEAERHRYYLEFLQTFASFPFGLGCHWYQWADQPITGRLNDGESDCIGFVDIADQPHPEMVTALREAAESVYTWHHASGEM